MVLKLSFRYKLLLSLFFAFLICLFCGISMQKKSVLATLPVSDRIIVVDAGHGGLDGGATTKDGILEKDINLNIARYLESYLNQGGAKVVMTRADDISLFTDKNASVKQKKRQDLLKRREIANSSGADMMISIHLNQFSESKYSGAQVFYETNFAESKLLAGNIQNSLKNQLNKENNRVEMQIDKSKLQFQELSVPSVIVECGFLSNPEEALLLNTPEYQQKVALSIYLGILKFYNGN